MLNQQVNNSRNNLNFLHSTNSLMMDRMNKPMKQCEVKEDNFDIRELSKSQLLRLKPDEISELKLESAFELCKESVFCIQQTLGFLPEFIHSFVNQVDDDVTINDKSISRLIKGTNQNHPACAVKDDHVGRHITSGLNISEKAKTKLNKEQKEKISIEIIRLKSLLDTIHPDSHDLSKINIQNSLSSVFSSLQLATTMRISLITQANKLALLYKDIKQIGNRIIRKHEGIKHKSIVFDAITNPRNCGLEPETLIELEKALSELKLDVESQLGTSFAYGIEKLANLTNNINDYNNSISIIMLTIERNISKSVNYSKIPTNRRDDVKQECRAVIISALDNYSDSIAVSTFAQRYIKNVIFTAGQERGVVKQSSEITKYTKTILEVINQLDIEGKPYTHQDIADLVNKKRNINKITPEKIEHFICNQSISLENKESDNAEVGKNNGISESQITYSMGITKNTHSLNLNNSIDMIHHHKLTESIYEYLCIKQDKNSADLFFRRFGLSGDAPEALSELVKASPMGEHALKRLFENSTQIIRQKFGKDII